MTLPPAKRPGIREIAASLGVSTGTVSRSLNNRYGVNPETRDMVLKEARRLGYVPNQAARNLKDAPSLNVGLFFSPFTGKSGEINPAALERINAFKKAAKLAGMTVNVTIFSDLEELRAQMIGIDEAVFYGHFEEAAMQAAHDAGIPAVLLQHPPSAYEDQVALNVDTVMAGAAAVEYLAAHGHERIGIVLSPLTEIHASGLLKGYRRALAEFHLPADKAWVCELPPELANKDGARMATDQMMKLKSRPTALVFASDWMALGGIHAAREAGLKVPRDLSFIGFDNLNFAEETEPPLTTFDVHVEKEAEILTQLTQDLGLRRWVAKPGSPREVLLAPEMVRRQSVYCFRA